LAAAGERERQRGWRALRGDGAAFPPPVLSPRRQRFAPALPRLPCPPSPARDARGAHGSQPEVAPPRANAGGAEEGRSIISEKADEGQEGLRRGRGSTKDGLPLLSAGRHAVVNTATAWAHLARARGDWSPPSSCATIRVPRRPGDRPAPRSNLASLCRGGVVVRKEGGRGGGGLVDPVALARSLSACVNNNSSLERRPPTVKHRRWFSKFKVLRALRKERGL
jgi:hypothetical protein